MKLDIDEVITEAQNFLQKEICDKHQFCQGCEGKKEMNCDFYFLKKFLKDNHIVFVNEKSFCELEEKIKSGELHDGFKIGDEVWGIAFNTTKPMVHGKIIQMYLNEKGGRVFIQDVDDKEFYALCGYHYQIDVSLNAVYRTKEEAEAKLKDLGGMGNEQRK